MNSSSENHKNIGSLVGKLSPNDSSFEALFAKLGVVWLAYFVGLNLQEWLSMALTFASLTYVIVNTYVLIRDKIVRYKKMKTDFGSLSEGE